MFKIKRLKWSKGYILVKPDGKQFTANIFQTKTEAGQFLERLTKDAAELISAISAK